MTSWINLQNKSFWPKVFFKVFSCCCWKSYRSLYRLQVLFSREPFMMTYSTCTAVLVNCVWRHRSLFFVLYAHLAQDITNNYYDTLLYIVLIIWCVVFSVAKSLQLNLKISATRRKIMRTVILALFLYLTTERSCAVPLWKSGAPHIP